MTVEKIQDGIIYLNVRGLLLECDKTKVSQLRDLAMMNNVYAIVLTETWLTSSILDAEVNIENFKLYRTDRSGQVHGGVCIYLRRDISANVVISRSDCWSNF